MKPWLALVVVFLAGCGVLPEQGVAMKKLAGTLTFREITALPSTATAHITLFPLGGAQAAPIATADFPARTGMAIPFELKFPASKVSAGGEYVVMAQVIDHGKVWYSNLANPLRISFLAEPGAVTIELRREPL